MLLADLVMGRNSLDEIHYLSDIENSTIQEPNFLQMIKSYEMDEELKGFICDCLEISPEKRPALSDLLQSGFLSNVQITTVSHEEWPIMAHTFDNSLKAHDIWYLWRVQNREKEQEKIQKIHNLKLPAIVRFSDDLDSIFDSFSKELSLPICLKEVELDVSGLMDESEISVIGSKLQSKVGVWEFNEIKESIKLFGKRREISIERNRKVNDVAYERSRITVFRNLLIRFPLSLEKIIVESSGGFPSHLRAAIYCALLQVEGDTSITFDAFNCNISTAMDQQVWILIVMIRLTRMCEDAINTTLFCHQLMDEIVFVEF